MHGFQLIEKGVSNLPWQKRPKKVNGAPIWRYSQNPVIGRNPTEGVARIFNSAVVPYGDGFAGVFRCDSKSISMDIFTGFSKDGVHWDIEDDAIVFQGADPEIAKRDFRYDPRVCWIEDRYYVTWCNGYHEYPTIGIGYTYDFKTYYGYR